MVCYIESSTGVAEGGYTRPTSVIIAILFFLALFLSPLAHMIDGGYTLDTGKAVSYYCSCTDHFRLSHGFKPNPD